MPSGGDAAEVLVMEVSDEVGEMRPGWLIFVPRAHDVLNVKGRRRLDSYPAHWHRLPEAELAQLFSVADPLPTRRPAEKAVQSQAEFEMLLERLHSTEQLLRATITERDQLREELEATISELVGLNTELQSINEKQPPKVNASGL